jgi:5'(3')-deoxyribonucleotidase
VQGYKVKILSASPNINADEDKINWLKKHLPNMKRKNIILCRNGEVKADFVRKIKKSMLFDDYGKNCRDFIASGGQAVKIITDRQLIRMVTAD